MHVNKSGDTSVVVQAVAQQNLRCTALFVGTPGERISISNNIMISVTVSHAI